MKLGDYPITSYPSRDIEYPDFIGKMTHEEYQTWVHDIYPTKGIKI